MTARFRRRWTALLGLTLGIGCSGPRSSEEGGSPTNADAGAPNDEFEAGVRDGDTMADVAAPARSAYYVAPAPIGNDGNPGTESQPFATITKARDVVRTVNRNMMEDIVVNLRQGDYYLTDTIQFTEADSGTNGHAVVYKNLDAVGSAHLIGGQRLTNWMQHSGSVYKAHVGTGWTFHTLYENGKRALKARFPDYVPDATYPASRAGYLLTDALASSHPASDDNLVLTYKPGALNPASWNAGGAQVVIWSGGWSWFTDIVPIAATTPSAREMTLAHPTRYPIYNPIAYLPTPSSRYFVQGALEFLTQPGEFYLDTSDGYLYYWARDGAISNQTIVAPKVKTILSIAGSSEAATAHHLRFEGLTVESSDFTDWYRHGWVNEGDSGEQHAHPEYDRQMNMPQHRTGMVFLQNTHDVTIKNCHLKNSGYSAVFMLFFNHDNTVYGNWLEHLGHSGVYLEGKYPGEGALLSQNTTNDRNVISNNLIHDIGELVGNASGVYLMNSSNNEVSHAEIYNSPRYAVVWDAYPRLPYESTYVDGNTLAYLDIYNCCQDSDDTSALNSFGLSPTDPLEGGNDALCQGTQFHDHVNRVEQVTVSNCYAHPTVQGLPPNGIYMDQGANGQLFTNVKVQNTSGVAYNGQNSCRPGFQNVSWEPAFDETKMDYANIGLKADFPTEYRRELVSDGFESGLGNWNVAKGSASAASTRSHAGTYSYVTDEALDVIYQASTRVSYSKVAVLWFYDDASDTSLAGMARVDGGGWDDGSSWRGIGVDTAVSTTSYVYRSGTTEVATTVTRTTGWHRFLWDYRSGVKVDLYVDGTLVASTPGVTSFNRVAMGNWWGSAYAGTVYFDDFAIQDSLP